MDAFDFKYNLIWTSENIFQRHSFKMMKTLFSKLPKTLNSNNHKLMSTATKAVIGTNGRRLPLPDDKPLIEHDPEIAQLLLKEQKR